MSYHKQVKRMLLAGVATATFATAIPAISSSAAYAQDYTTGMISGTVQDTTGNVVSGATITIKSNRGTSRTLTSGSDGSFRAPRLPIGQYTITVSHDGHDTLSDQMLNIGVNSTVEPTFTLSIPGSTIDEIVVSGMATGNWDFGNTETGISVNIDEMTKLVPLGRDATSVALLAPSTTRGTGHTNFRGLASFSGSSVAENVYYVNGLNVTDFRKLTGSSTVPFDFLETVEVKTGGYQAEFGRSTGGVMNMVTKSGSNDFKAGVNLYWTPNWARSENSIYRDETQVRNFNKTDELQYNAWASGALIKDKLFFYGMYQWEKNDYTSYGASSKTTDTERPTFWGGKVDFEPFDGHRFEFTIFSDEERNEHTAQNLVGLTEQVEFSGHDYTLLRTDLPEGFHPDDYVSGDPQLTSTGGGGLTKIYKYTGVFTDWMTISGLFGTNPAQIVGDEVSPLNYILDCSTGCGFLGQSAPASRVTTGADSRKAWRIDADLYFDFMGSHHIRVGIDKEILTSEQLTVRNGGSSKYYYNCTSSAGCRGIPQGELYVREYTSASGGTFGTIQTAQYIQDSWEVNQDLTITLGLRNETFDNRNSNGETFVKSPNQVAVRAGFTWDPTGEGSSRVFGSLGRYFLPIAANTNVRNAGSEFYYFEYNYLDQANPYDAVTGLPNYDTSRPGALSSTTIPGSDGGTYSAYQRLRDDGTIPNPLTKAQQGLKPQYMDEVILGYEHSFDNGWTVSVNGMYRKLQNMIEDIGVNEGLALWGLANGKDPDLAISLLDVTTNGQTRYIIANPGTELTYLEDFYTTDGSTELVTISAEDLGYPKGSRNYYAVEAKFDREWDGKWMVGGSYIWSRTTGNYEGSVNSDIGQEDPGLTRDFDLPFNMVNAKGPLANSRTHKFKIRGAYMVNDQITVGGNFVIESPRKFGCRGNLPVDTQFNSTVVDAFNTYVTGGDAAATQEALWDYHGQDGAAYWFCDGENAPRGSGEKASWFNQLDLNLSFTPSFNDDIPGEVSFQLNVFNVFNTASVTEIDMLKERSQTSFGQYAANGNAYDQNLWYNTPSRVQAPRRLRMSMKYNF